MPGENIMTSFQYNGHTIGLQDLQFVKKIFYDGREMASRATFWGGSDMSFVVTENGEQVTYELTTKVGFFKDTFIVRRNGIMIYSE